VLATLFNGWQGRLIIAAENMDENSSTRCHGQPHKEGER
jgi:hypothetical protein